MCDILRRMTKFYVYALFDADGIVRYIGKGKNGRWTQHASDKRRAKPFIQEAIARLGDYPRLKIREGLSEFEAYQVEQALISAIGLAPDGPLVNRTAKGSGPNSHQVRVWHSERSPEDKSASARKSRATFAASTPFELRSGIARANALAVGRDTLSLRMKEARNAQTAEKRTEIGHSGGVASAAALSPEARKERSAKARSAYLANTTVEMRRENAKRTGLGQASKSSLSEWGRKGSATLNGSRTPEQRREFARKAALAGAAKRRAQREQLTLNLVPQFAGDSSIPNDDVGATSPFTN